AAGLEKIVFAGYPITPASPLLHTLANLKSHGVITFQAEDEIAAIGAAIGAAYAGALGVTSSSGPGIALKTEMLGLAIATELPIVLVDSQRAGPSTGMPTKTEQSDLFQAVLGRNADSPLAVIGWGSPFGAIHEAVRRARGEGFEVSHIHVRYLSPFPANLGELLHRFERVLVPELNNGQLVQLLRAAYLIDAQGFNKISGKPFHVAELAAAIREHAGRDS